MDEIIRSVAHAPKLVFFMCWTFYLAFGFFILSRFLDSIRPQKAFVWASIWIAVGAFWSIVIYLATGVKPF